MKNIRFFATIGFLACIISCQKAAPEEENVVFNPASITLSADGGSETVSLTANYDWTATKDVWINLSATSGKGSTSPSSLTVSAEANETGADRSGVVTIKLPQGKTAKLTVSQAAVKAKTIASVADLKAFADAIAAKDVSKWIDTDNEVKIVADIDVSSMTSPLDTIPMGIVLNGQNHKIYNIAASSDKVACFIKSNAGTVKNLVFGSKDGSSYDGKSAFTFKAIGENASGCGYAGIIGFNYGTLENITNYAKVNVPADDNIAAFIGGIVAKWSGVNTEGKGLKNYGEISNSATMTLATGAIAGLVGTSDQAFKLTDCHNYANITSKGQNSIYCAGLVGQPTTGIVTFESCTNSGNIEVDSEMSFGTVCIGGMTSFVNAGATFISCSNTGNFKSTVKDVEQKMGGIIAAANGQNPVVVKECVNGDKNAKDTKGQFVITAAESSKGGFVGGIFGNCAADQKSDITIEKCVNYANITFSVPYVRSIGGIFGHPNSSNCNVTLSDCNNYGNLTQNCKTITVGVRALGGIAGYWDSGNATVTNCVNEGIITACGAGNVVRLGGVIGTMHKNKNLIKNCTNKGKVTFNETDEFGNWFVAGGIIGWQENSTESKFDGCINYADVTIDIKNVTTHAVGLNAGGIVGASKKTLVIDGCKNYGKVVCNNSGNAATWVGGVLGGNNDQSVTIKSASVFGSVTSTCENLSIGSIAGYLNAVSILESATICNEVSVNGTKKAIGEYTDNADKWAVGKLDGTLSKYSVVAHSSSE